MLQREEAARAEEAARVEAELAKRQAERKRAKDVQERERARTERDREKQAHEAHVIELKREVENRTQLRAALERHGKGYVMAAGSTPPPMMQALLAATVSVSGWASDPKV